MKNVISMKRNLSLVLAVVMLISVLGAFPAYAADIEAPISEADLSEQELYVVEPRVNKDFVVNNLKMNEWKEFETNDNSFKESFTFTIKSMGSRVQKVKIQVMKTYPGGAGAIQEMELSNNGTWTCNVPSGGRFKLSVMVVEGTVAGASTDSVTIHVKDNY